MTESRPGAVAALSNQLVLSADQLAEGLLRMVEEDALSLPFMAPALCDDLMLACEDLSYREARPLVGVAGKEVEQDFELSLTFPEGSVFRDFALAHDQLLEQAIALLPEKDRPISDFSTNDLIVQRYQPGSRGITPHRDHIRYEGLVSLVVLAGDADFYICEDRAGAGARLIPSPPGYLILMRAPGYAGSKKRPFHQLRDIRSYRVSAGLRHDVRWPEPMH